MEEKKMAVLIVATVSGFVPQFEMQNVKIIESMGYKVHYATNFNNPVYEAASTRLNNSELIKHQIDFVRNPLNIRNIKAYVQLKRLMEAETFQMVHCHTPVGGALARLAAKKTKVPFVIYTAHGFHFYRGASIFRWLIFYPIEKRLARMTDRIITINKEDFAYASKFRLKNGGRAVLIPGVGIDLASKENQDRKIHKEDLGLGYEHIVLTSVGELSKRKNHKVIIQAMDRIVKVNPNIVYLICGKGCLEHKLKKLVEKKGLQNNIIFMGYCASVSDVLDFTDCFVFPSLQEGLPVAVLEAMRAGVPVIASNIRGNSDLIQNEKGGYLVKRNSAEEYADRIIDVVTEPVKARKYGEFNKERIKAYEKSIVAMKMKKLYSECLK